MQHGPASRRIAPGASIIATERENRDQFRRWFQTAGYSISRVSIALALVSTFFSFGVELRFPIPDPVPFVCVFSISTLPALVVGVLEGLARLPTQRKWSGPLRISATLLVALLGAFFIVGDLGVFYSP